MPASNVIGFSENIPTMTNDEGLAFIARMRRQLDRFEVAVPGTNGRRMDREYELEIRRLCDEVESEIKARQESI